MEVLREEQLKQRIELSKCISSKYSPEIIKKIMQEVVDEPIWRREIKAKEMRVIIEECETEQDAIEMLHLDEEKTLFHKGILWELKLSLYSIGIEDDLADNIQKLMYWDNKVDVLLKWIEHNREGLLEKKLIDKVLEIDSDAETYLAQYRPPWLTMEQIADSEKRSAYRFPLLLRQKKPEIIHQNCEQQGFKQGK